MILRRLYKKWPRLRRWRRRRRDAAVYWLVRLALWVLRLLSLERALRVADRIGDLAFWTLRGPRRLAIAQVGAALGDEAPPAVRSHIVQASFRNLARCFCELAKFETIRPQIDSYVAVEGWQHAEQVMAEGRGGIVITGHIGNWELMAAYCALKGVPVGAIARRMNDPRLNALVVDFRARHGVRTILRESPSASREILKVLNAKGFLALVIDQDTHAPSVSVPFFGRVARTPVAAASLAVRRDLPVLPAFMQRRSTAGHRLTILPPVRPPHSGDRRQDILEMTRAFNRILEDRVRKNPAEWVWWHRRWRRAPIARLDLDHQIHAPAAD